jgi:hypothetical protein
MGVSTIRDAVQSASDAARMAETISAAATIARVVERQTAGLKDVQVPTFSIDLPDAATLLIAERAAAQSRMIAEALARLTPTIQLRDLSLDYERILAPVQAVVDSLAKIDLAPLLEPLQAALRTWERRLAELAPEKRRVVEYLAERGWHQSLFMPWWDAQLLALVDRGDVAAVDAYMTNRVEETFDELRDQLAKDHPRRLPLVEKALAAHIAGDYVLAIPVALAQTDGITFELVALQAFSRRDGKPVTAVLVQERMQQWGGGGSIDWLLADLLPLHNGSSIQITTAERDRRRTSDPTYGPLNRHGVLHGLDVDYGTRENSARAFALLGYFVGLRRLLDIGDGGPEE